MGSDLSALDIMVGLRRVDGIHIQRASARAGFCCDLGSMARGEKKHPLGLIEGRPEALRRCPGAD